LVHQACHGGGVPVEALSARRHGVADVDATLHVVFDADFTQVVRLLEVDRILVARRARRSDGDDVAAKGVLDVARARARDVAADLSSSWPAITPWTA
jgi:hypothetical protein